MQVKNSKLFLLHRLIGVMDERIKQGGIKLPFKVKYALAANKRKLQPIIDSANEAKAYSKEYLAYEKKLAELAPRFAQLDKKGNPVQLKQAGDRIIYPIDPKKEDEYQEERGRIDKAHKDVIEEQQQKELDYRKFLTEESTKISLFKFDASLMDEGLDELFDLTTIELFMELGIIDEAQ